MDSTEAGSVEDSKSTETTVEDIVKYEDSEVLSSQNEEDQSGEKVYGYLYRSAGCEDATINVDSRGFNLNGQNLIVTQNDDGNEIIVLVGEDPDDQTLEQTFAHSVLQSDEVAFEKSLKEHGTLLVDEHSQGLEFMERKETSHEHEERHMYIENSGEFLNISNENPVDIESPLWSVSNSGHLKNDGTEMLFIPNPTVTVLNPPEETKHQKLMQLACIAHELQSADQKSSSTVICDYVKDQEASVTEEGSPIKDEEKSDEEAHDKSSYSNEREECVTFNSKPTKVSSMRAVDNTVSVIHSTSSEIQSNTSENQTKLQDFSSEKNFSNSENELPSEMLYSNVAFHSDMDESTKQLEECSRDSLEEEKSQSLIPEITDEKGSVQNENLELNNNDSPLIFIEKTDHLNVDSLNTEDDDTKIDDDSHADSSALVIEDGDLKSHDSDSSASLMECHLAKEIDRSEINSQEDNALGETVSDIDDDNRSSTEHSVSISENDSPFLSSQYSVFNFKQKAKNPSLEKSPILLTALQDDKSQTDTSQADLNESNTKDRETKLDENLTGNDVEFEQSPPENLDSDLIIAETIEDSESKPKAVGEGDSSEDISDKFREDLKSQSPPADARTHTTELIFTENVNPVLDSEFSLKPDTLSFHSKKPNDEFLSEPDIPPLHPKEPNDEFPSEPDTPLFDPKEPNDEVNQDRISLNASPARSVEECSGPSAIRKSMKKTRIRSPKDEEDDYSSSEETPLMKRTRKTYEKKEKKIILYSDEINDCINDAETASRTDESCKKSPSPQENISELDAALESNVCAPKNYVNSVPKQKFFYRKKKLRSHRPRFFSSVSPLNNGNSEVSDSDSKKNSFDSDNIPWGKVLLETSFEPRNLPNDAPSTSFASQYPNETSNPVLSPEQRRRKMNKCKRDFDRLLHSSSPISTKQPKMGKFSSRMHPHVIRATKSQFSSSRFSKSLPLSSSSSSSTGLSKSRPRKKVQIKNLKVKKAKIHYLHGGGTQQPQEASASPNDMYSCGSCNFSSIYVDNLMEHLKYCSHRHPILDYEVNNMDKRQRIRGEEEITNTINNTLKKIRSDLRSSFLEDDISVIQVREEERDSELVQMKKALYREYGYGEDDVVWVNLKSRFWPALILQIYFEEKGPLSPVCSSVSRPDGDKEIVINTDAIVLHVKLISYPNEEKSLKVRHDDIRTFDNSKWNLLCLAESEKLPHHEIFVKAVQSSERFMSKKFLGIQVTGKEFFSVRDEVDFVTDGAASSGSHKIQIQDLESDNELYLRMEPARRARYDKLDLSTIFQHMIRGRADDYVLDIYHKKKKSEKHSTFFSDDNSSLKHRPWFGPFEDKNQRGQLFNHYRELFLNKIGKKSFFVSYICQVMIPEAIVKAISVVNEIPLKDAEVIFDSEDSLDDGDNDDPSIEDILEKYS